MTRATTTTLTETMTVSIRLENIKLMELFLENDKEIRYLTDNIIRNKSEISWKNKLYNVPTVSSNQPLKNQEEKRELENLWQDLCSFTETRDLLSQKNKQLVGELLQACCGTKELFDLLKKLVLEAIGLKEIIDLKEKLIKVYNKNLVAFEKGIKKFNKRLDNKHNENTVSYKKKIASLEDQIRLETRVHKNELLSYNLSIERWKLDLDDAIEEIKVRFIIDSELELQLKESTF